MLEKKCDWCRKKKRWYIELKTWYEGTLEEERVMCINCAVKGERIAGPADTSKIRCQTCVYNGGCDLPNYGTEKRCRTYISLSNLKAHVTYSFDTEEND